MLPQKTTQIKNRKVIFQTLLSLDNTHHIHFLDTPSPTTSSPQQIFRGRTTDRLSFCCGHGVCGYCCGSRVVCFGHSSCAGDGPSSCALCRCPLNRPSARHPQLHHRNSRRHAAPRGAPLVPALGAVLGPTPPAYPSPASLQARSPQPPPAS